MEPTSTRYASPRGPIDHARGLEVEHDTVHASSASYFMDITSWGHTREILGDCRLPDARPVRVTGFRPARRHAAWVLNLECWILSPMPCGSVITAFQPSNTRILNAISRSRAHTCARPGQQARLAKTLGGDSFLSRRRLSGSDH